MKEILKNIKNVYFVGIGGIGMSALARYFKANGYEVAGYDKTPSALTEKMRTEEAIEVNYTDAETEIGQNFRGLDTLVIYTPAIPEDSKQLNYFCQAGFQLHKRAEVLGMLSCNHKALCIAGTHGKTTVSTMTAFLLKNSTVGCNAFLGGISVNFGTNLLIDKNSEYVVIEADEFDRSFLHLHPEMAVITAMDEDHLDIYHNKANLIQAFEEFARKVKPETGKLFIKKGLQIKTTPVTGQYAVGEPSDYFSDHLRVIDGHYVFNYHGKNIAMIDLILGIPGRVNVENATVAITLALQAGVKPEEIRKALPLFRGVVRRFNIQVDTPDIMYIDDYAHHPKEIEATLSSIKEMWPDKKMMVIFQPHLYSRTHDFQNDFAHSLSLADEVILLDIYPARELPILGITSEIIREKLTVPGKIIPKEKVIEYIEKNFKKGILITMGAGDIDRLIPLITDKLNTKNRKGITSPYV